MKIEGTVSQVETLHKSIKTVTKEIITLDPDDIREAVEMYLNFKFPEKHLKNPPVKFLHRVIRSYERELDESDWDGYGQPGGRLLQESSEFYGAEVTASFDVLNGPEVSTNDRT